MRICGIVSEYNPFHNGHQKHIALTREKSGADFIVCVMSGNFVQRGEPAIFDKWTRAKCALMGGADAVIELPLLTATQSAEGFAAGAVAILDAIGAESISFGSETDNIDMLCSIAKTLCNESPTYKKTLKHYLNEGLSFPKARMKAAFPDVPDALNMPNAILGIEYLKSIFLHKYSIKPIAIKRIGQSYHSADIASSLASATAIRKAIRKNDRSGAYNAMPKAVGEYLTKQMLQGIKPVYPDYFNHALAYRLRLGGTHYIKTLHEVSEGLENRIYEASKHCQTRKELIEQIKTKRYTYTRISRILLYALLGITRTTIEQHNLNRVGYIRILAAKNSDVLSQIYRKSKVPMISGSVVSSPYSEIDIAASDVYALSQDTKPFCNASRDFTQRLILNH